MIFKSQVVDGFMSTSGTASNHLTMLLLIVFYVQFPKFSEEKIQNIHQSLFWWAASVHAMMIVSIVVKKSNYLLFMKCP